MATTPGSRRRETRTDITGEDRNTLSSMQQPLGSMDTPGTSDFDEINLGPNETVRRTGNLGATNPARGATTEPTGRSFTATFVIVAAVLVAAFLLALYFGNNRSDIATAPGASEAPVAATGSGTSNDTTGSTTIPPQQTVPGSGAAKTTTGTTTGTTPPPANP